MDNKGPDREYVRMLEALATVSSLAFMAVIDFLLAYFGGNWLDSYFNTGSHIMRSLCICLAIVTLLMTYYNLIKKSILSRDKENKSNEE